jgi:DNA-binding transcriptional LysR family regulator
MDRFASITAFVRVTESGGFSAAGRRLNLSKATVSDQVQALENALGVRLLNRTTRRVSLTEIGRNYYDRCVQILHDLEEADETAGAQQATPRGQLRVYCQLGIVRFVTPVVTDFLARYPEASVDLRTGPTMIDLVQEAFDLGISPFPPPDATLVRRRLGTLSLMVCGAPAYLEKHALPGRPGRPQLPALPPRTVSGRVVFCGCAGQHGGGAHIGKPDQQPLRNHARRCRGRHRPTTDGAVPGC